MYTLQLTVVVLIALSAITASSFPEKKEGKTEVSWKDAVSKYEKVKDEDSMDDEDEEIEDSATKEATKEDKEINPKEDKPISDKRLLQKVFGADKRFLQTVFGDEDIEDIKEFLADDEDLDIDEAVKKDPFVVTGSIAAAKAAAAAAMKLKSWFWRRRSSASRRRYW